MKPIKVTEDMVSGASGLGTKYSTDFIGDPYQINNPKKIVLQPGDECWCHPTEWSHTDRPYKVYIIMAYKTLKVFVPGQHARELNEYLFPRLEFIKRL